jgi:hypothetical protein
MEVEHDAIYKAEPFLEGIRRDVVVGTAHERVLEALIAFERTYEERIRAASQ